jgi:hypothetical protein
LGKRGHLYLRKGIEIINTKIDLTGVIFYPSS